MNGSTAKRLARRVVGVVLALNLVVVAGPATAAPGVSHPSTNPGLELDSGSWSSAQPNSGSWSGPRVNSGSWS